MRRSFKANRRKKSVSFNPSSEYLNEAIEDYVQKGGEIKVIEGVNDYYDEFIAIRERNPPADEFLLGH